MTLSGERTGPLLGTLVDALAPAYRVLEPVGRGAAAMVYRAHDVRHDRDVALKVLDPVVSVDVGVERFLREMRIAARLAHPHILPLHDSGQAGGWLYYVTPYVAGGSLRARLRRDGPLRVGDALRIAMQVAGALDYAHRSGVVHRDVKPDNVLLHEGQALVADFGIARALDEAAGTGGTAHLTRTGLAVGTPTYMSPEQATGERDVDGRSDVYSLACVLYEMLAGHAPFTGATARAVIARRFLAEPPPLATVRPDIPAWLDPVLARGLAPEPGARFPTAAAFGRALTDRGLAGDDDEAAEPPYPTVQAPVPRVTEPGAAASGAVAAGAPANAVAVLPFVDLSAAGDEAYFGDGMAEEVINALAHVPGLRIASRTSAFALRGAAHDVREIGRRLGVAAVLEGTVRRAGTRLRVSAQLSDTSTGYQRWAGRYDRDLDDVFAIQDELARTIVEALAPALAPASGTAATRPATRGRDGAGLVRRYTENLAAYDLYLRGRHHLSHLTADGLGAAIDLFERAVAEDPGQAPAHAALASTYVAYVFYGVGAWSPRVIWERARRAATAALEIDPALADAIGALGTTRWACDWDFVGAERALGRAVELKPGDSLLHNWHGWALLLLGRADECLLALERARDLDPLSPFAQRSVCRALYFDRRHDRAVSEARRLLARFPGYTLAQVDLASALLAQEDAAGAGVVLTEARALRPDDPRLAALAGFAAARSGDRDTARGALATLDALARTRYVTPVDRAIVRLGLGERDAALGALEAARDERDTWVPWLRCWPLFDELRGTPRFDALAAVSGPSSA
jgi:serine/threonine-protein kinase